MDINGAAFFIPDEGSGGKPVTLSRPISAIQLVRKEDGSVRLGVLAQLRPGTQVVLCGTGFNERTVKVRAEGDCYYFIFRQDLESQALAAAV
jgi:hypothetical protein